MDNPQFQFSLRTAFIVMLLMAGLLYINIRFGLRAIIIIDTIAGIGGMGYLAYTFQDRTKELGQGAEAKGLSKDFMHAFGEFVVYAVLIAFVWLLVVLFR